MRVLTFVSDFGISSVQRIRRVGLSIQNSNSNAIIISSPYASHLCCQAKNSMHLFIISFAAFVRWTWKHIKVPLTCSEMKCKRTESNWCVLLSALFRFICTFSHLGRDCWDYCWFELVSCGLRWNIKFRSMCHFYYYCLSFRLAVYENRISSC